MQICDHLCLYVRTVPTLVTGSRHEQEYLQTGQVRMNAINLKHEFLGLFKLNVFYSMFKIRKGFEKCIEESYDVSHASSLPCHMTKRIK